MWMQTYTGKKIDFLNPQVDQISTVDLAHQLANTNRWCGAMENQISVLEHSIFVFGYVEKGGANDKVQLQALLHDAHEAYTGDLSRPFKLAIESLCENAEDSPIRIIETRLDAVIGEKYGVDLLNKDASIKHADDLLMKSEFISFSATPAIDDWVGLKSGDEILRIKKNRRMDKGEMIKFFLNKVNELSTKIDSTKIKLVK